MKIEKTIDRDSKQKLYVQIYSIIKEKIESGEWSMGIQIPTEDELCKTYDVSKVTVREAIQELVREGYLKRQQGKGTFVTYSISQLGLIMRTRLSDAMYGEGVTVNREILEIGLKKPSDDIKTILTTEDDVYYVLCKKYVNDIVSIEEAFIPFFELPNVEDDMLYQSFLDLLEGKGTKKLSRVIQTIEISTEKGDVTDYLPVIKGATLLIVSRIFMSSDGSPIAYVRNFGSGIKNIHMEFERI